MGLRTALLLVVVGFGWSGVALADNMTYRSETLATGKVARIAVVTSLKRDCSPGPAGSLKIVTAPKNGSLVVRSGKVKTPASFRCPNIEAAAEALFYQSKPNYSGPDEIVYETRAPEGAVQSFTVRITVQSGGTGKPSSPSTAPKDKKGDTLDL